MILVYLLSGEIKISVTIVTFEVTVKMLIYYLHERAWEKVQIVDDI